MFRGVSALNLDDKGRLTIPTKYRDALREACEGRVVVTVADSERCLWLYPLPQWEAIEKKLVDLPSVNPVHQRLKRILIGHATDCEVDGSGRVLLSPPLREFADLEKRAVLIGQGNKLEIWNEDSWNRRREEWLQQTPESGAMSVELESLSL